MEGREVYGERLGLRHKWSSCGVQAEFAAWAGGRGREEAKEPASASCW